jgi:hypothetical protein
LWTEGDIEIGLRKRIRLTYVSERLKVAKSLRTCSMTTAEEALDFDACAELIGRLWASVGVGRPGFMTQPDAVGSRP